MYIVDVCQFRLSLSFFSIAATTGTQHRRMCPLMGQTTRNDLHRADEQTIMIAAEQRNARAPGIPDLSPARTDTRTPPTSTQKTQSPPNPQNQPTTRRKRPRPTNNAQPETRGRTNQPPEAMTSQTEAHDPQQEHMTSQGTMTSRRLIVKA